MTKAIGSPDLTRLFDGIDHGRGVAWVDDLDGERAVSFARIDRSGVAVVRHFPGGDPILSAASFTAFQIGL